MTKRFSVIDVETPNLQNDRICSIGITCIDDEKIISSRGFYINPECNFHPNTINIHNITPEMVNTAPSFPEIWANISKHFENAVLVAHNALFDLTVLKKVFSHYDIPLAKISYIDTLAVSKQIFPELPNHRLDTLCEYLGIPLIHHNAESDSFATANLLLTVCSRNDNFDISHYVSEYDFSYISSDNKHENHPRPKLSDKSLALCELKDFLSDIASDGTISKGELQFMEKWISLHPYLHGEYPYDAICTSLQCILADGVVGLEELEELLSLCNKLIDPLNCSCCNCSAIQLEGKNFVLSGEFCHGSKSNIERILAERGAIMQKSITKKTDILLVGDCGSDAWVAGNYGTKVKKALELQEKGIDILIIREGEFFKELNL